MLDVSVNAPPPMVLCSKKAVGWQANWSYRSDELVRSVGHWSLEASGIGLQATGFRGQELVNKGMVLPISRVLGGGDGGRETADER